MQSIGETLRKARESKGITLDQAEDDTKIRKRYLQALEDGDYDIIPGLVYAKGFLRNYSGYLGLNQEEIMIEYKLAAVPPKEEGPKEDIRETINRRRAIKRSNKRAYMAAAVVALFAMATFAVYGFIAKDPKDSPVTTGNSQPTAVASQKASGAKQSPKTDKTVNSPDNSTGGSSNDIANNSPVTSTNGGAVNTETGSNINSGTNAGNESTVNSPNTGIDAPSDGKVVVILSGRDQACWTKVLVDGQVVFSGQINPGETKSFSGAEKVKFRLGNAGAVDVNVNGQQLGALGPIGKVVDKEYSSQPANNG